MTLETYKGMTLVQMKIIANQQKSEIEGLVERCAATAEQVAAACYPENSIDWNDGFGRGAYAAADRIREIIFPQQPSAT